MKSKCILCSDTELKYKFKDLVDEEYDLKGTFSFEQCPRCGLMVLYPKPSLEDLKAYYPSEYHIYNISKIGIASLYHRLVDYCRFREYVRLIGLNAEIFDIGCADMPYFDLVNSKYPNLKLAGIEFIDEIAEKGRKKGRNIITGTIADLDSKESYDLIIMNNLIEHVIDPVKEMEKAHSLLRPKGYIFLQTPNAESWDYAIGKRYWGSLHIPRHTYLFSQSSIKLLAKKTGFKIVKTKYLLSAGNWALSIQNYFQSTKIFRCFVRNGRTWYYKYLFLAFIPFCAFQKMFKKTGEIVVILQKDIKHMEYPKAI